MKNLILFVAALAMAPAIHAAPATLSAAQASVMTDGEVRRIDTSNSKITLKHGPIVNLDMPGMTMVFRVQPADLLSGIKVGDAVKFHAERIDGVFVITSIQSAQ